MGAKKKLTLYFPESYLKEAKEEATRQDRSVSWIVQAAWRIARKELKKYPSVDDVFGDVVSPSSQ